MLPTPHTPYCRRKRALKLLLLFTIILGIGSSYGPAAKVQAANWPEQTIQIPTQGISFDCDVSVQMSSSECNALVTLFQNTDGANWKTNTNWLIASTPCTWYGIMCNNEGSVISIDLGANELNGVLPEELGNLENLRMLGLWENQISGPIPKTIGNLTELGILDLSQNTLTGTIPHEIGNLHKLSALWLSENRLTGVVPASLAGLENLAMLHIERNSLNGQLPVALFDLPQNEELNFGYNAIEVELGIFRSSTDDHNLTTQTVPPNNLFAEPTGTESIMLTWMSIDYQDNNGFYEISYRTDEENDHTVYGKTATDVAAIEIDGLQPDTLYHFVVRTYTPPHAQQTNAIWSSYSESISQTTEPEPVVVATPTPQPASDLTITAIEVTQGLQNLANEMPLIANRETWVRVYAKSDLSNTDGVSAQLRAFQNGNELTGSPLAMEYEPITVRTDGGSRVNLADNFHFALPASWLTGTVTFRAEINHNLSVPESVEDNNSWEESVNFHPSEPLKLVMVPIKLHKEGDSSQPEQFYKTDDPNFNTLIANSYRYIPVSTIEWREHTEILEPDCDGLCDIETYTAPVEILNQIEEMRIQEEGVRRFYETSSNEHWIGMVAPNFFFGGLSIRPQKSYWREYSAWSSISTTYASTTAAPFEIGGSLALMHEIGHNMGMMHIDCQAGEANVSASYPYSATDNSECSIDEINEDGFYGFDVYYQAAGLEKPVVISNDPASDDSNRAYPMMSYKFPGWPSPYKYCQLLIKFDVPCTLFDYEGTAVTGTNSEPTSTLDIGDTRTLMWKHSGEEDELQGEEQSNSPVESEGNLILPKNGIEATLSSTEMNVSVERIIEVDPTTGESSLEVVNIQDAQFGYATSNGQMLYYVSHEEKLITEEIVYTLSDREGISTEHNFEVQSASISEPPSILLPLIMNK